MPTSLKFVSTISFVGANLSRPAKSDLQRPALGWLDGEGADAYDEYKISIAWREIYAAVIPHYPRPLVKAVAGEPELDFLFPRMYKAVM